jgi:hypothetical protein
MADEAPTGFDSIFSFHRVFHNKDGAGYRQARGWVINPILYTPSSGNQFFGGGRHY